jgi:hypothetical protein
MDGARGLDMECGMQNTKRTEQELWTPIAPQASPTQVAGGLGASRGAESWVGAGTKAVNAKLPIGSRLPSNPREWVRVGCTGDWEGKYHLHMPCTICVGQAVTTYQCPCG